MQSGSIQEAELQEPNLQEFNLQEPELREPRLHVGLIMDGNGRWAATRGLPRSSATRPGSARCGGWRGRHPARASAR